MLWLEEMFPPTLKIAHVLLDTPGYHVNNVALVIHVLYRTDLLILLACHANVTTTRLLVTQTTGFAKSVSILQLVTIARYVDLVTMVTPQGELQVTVYLAPVLEE